MIAEVFKTRKQLFLRVPTFKQEYRFRLLGNNGEVIAQSEGYTSKQSATKTLRQYFPGFEVKDLT